MFKTKGGTIIRLEKNSSYLSCYLWVPDNNTNTTFLKIGSLSSKFPFDEFDMHNVAIKTLNNVKK